VSDGAAARLLPGAGRAETATTDEIKKAFRRLAKQHHPDRNPNNPQSAERFKEITKRTMC